MFIQDPRSTDRCSSGPRKENVLLEFSRRARATRVVILTTNSLVPAISPNCSFVPALYTGGARECESERASFHLVFILRIRNTRSSSAARQHCVIIYLPML